MRQKNYIGFFVIVIVLAQGCVEKFEPPVTLANKNFLVVDGSIKNGADSTIIKLSRTVNLGNSVSSIPEMNAHLFIEKDGAINYTLYDLGGGRYGYPGLQLDMNDKYRLRIALAGGMQYLSDEITVSEAPSIDSITFSVKSNGVTFSVNTHDPQNNTRYYKWEFDETWEYHSKYESNIEFINGAIVARAPGNEIFVCYSTNKSTEILLGSSTSLAEDIIHEQPLLTIPAYDKKISVRYSLLVKQYALTQDAFAYWQNIKKTTEQLGSIFDAQPSQFKGNIHSVSDPTEPVMGYISASSIKEKRIFVTSEDVKPTYYTGRQCELKVLAAPAFVGNVGMLPVGVTGFPPAYTWAEMYCVDCRLEGGTTIKPSFW